ncbi:MAG: hypothetical protein K6F09_02710 [Clostridiales bacterium]|nr:hypothetical protein [Clostridiales bacterium]
MNDYEKPAFTVIRYDVEDVIAASSGPGGYDSGGTISLSDNMIDGILEI